MRGRRPSGTEVVDRQEGSVTAKERVKVVLETIAGVCRVKDACQRLGISEQRFRQLREEILAGALASAEPGTPGRPAKRPSPIEAENRSLQERLAAQDMELRTAQARAEIAVTLPRVVHETGVGEKKTSGRPPQARGRPPGTRKRT
jgi:hypothetical protein